MAASGVCRGLNMVGTRRQRYDVQLKWSSDVAVLQRSPKSKFTLAEPTVKKWVPELQFEESPGFLESPIW